MASRWSHRCPRCGKRITWRRVYCRLCIEQDPILGSSRIGINERWLKGKRLPGISTVASTLRIRFRPSGNGSKFIVICLECGHKSSDVNSKHRCYWQTPFRHHKSVCCVCHDRRKAIEFPVINKWLNRGTVRLRAVVCQFCLDNTKIVGGKRHKVVTHA